MKTQNTPRNFDAEHKTEDEWAAFVKMKAATLSMCTMHLLNDIKDKRSWHADASKSKETLIDKVTTHLVADAKLKEQASLKEIVLLQDNFSEFTGSGCEGFDCRGPPVGRGEQRQHVEVRQVPQRAAHSSCVAILNRFLAGHEHVVCTPQWRGGAGHLHLGEAFCQRQGQ